MKKQISQEQLRRRKFLMVLPLLVIPFLTFAFWALGGGKGTVENQTRSAGLNLELPGANLKDDKAIDKMGYYEKAASDSARLKELMKNDPYYKPADTLSDHSMEQLMPPSKTSKKYTDPNEEKVYKKLAQLNSVLNTKPPVANESPAEKITTNNTPDIGRLEQMMQNIGEGQGDEDPEMKQMNGMLEKILDIQHPDRVKEKLKQISIKNKEQVFPVTVSTNDNISLLGNEKTMDTVKRSAPQNGFYSLSENVETDSASLNTIAAIIHESETLVSGSIVKLRLVSDVYINGVLVPKNNLVFGTALLNGERLTITVNTIRCNDALLPVDLAVFDLDGMEGIYIPGAITRDVAKQSTENALQQIGISNADPSIGAQAIATGIDAGKTLLSKKAKLVKVTVKAGYQILLRDNHNK